MSPSTTVNTFILPHFDRHRRLGGVSTDRFIRAVTGFTGSTAIAIWAPKGKAIVVDSRYTLQAKEECPEFEVVEGGSLRATDASLASWFLEHTPKEVVVATDLRLWSVEEIHGWLDAFPGLRFTDFSVESLAKVVAEDPDQLESPQATMDWCVEPYPLQYAGTSSTEKLKEIRTFLQQKTQEELGKKGAWGAIVASPEEIAWLLNLRAKNWQAFGCSPTFPSFAYLTDKDCTLFVPKGTQWTLPEDLPNLKVETFDEKTQEDSLKPCIQQANPEVLWVELNHTPQRLAALLKTFTLRPFAWPPLRQCKNEVELKNTRDVHLAESAAVIRLLAWLEENDQPLTELDIANRLEEIRQEHPLYKGPSFPSIVAAGAHSAVIHYVPSEKTNAPWRRDSEPLLLDVGGHYLGGTTDLTRTLWLGKCPPSDLFQQAYTAVLRGHVALASLVFPCSTTGRQVDALARQFLWRYGWNYKHGTGHGVGNYLAVHEGPVSLSPKNNTPLQSTMVLSIEPGVYFEGQFGLRLENLYEITPASDREDELFLRFLPLTFIPFDARCVNLEELTPFEREWLARYHTQMAERVSPLLKDHASALSWLQARVHTWKTLS